MTHLTILLNEIDLSKKKVFRVYHGMCALASLNTSNQHFLSTKKLNHSIYDEFIYYDSIEK